MIDDDLLRAAPAVIARLAASDRSTWDRLLAPISPLPPDEACPPVLLRALLAVDDPKGWRARCDGAYVGSAPWDAGAGHYVVDPWLARGVLREISDPRLRYEALLIEAGPDATRLSRELVRDAGKASDAPLLANTVSRRGRSSSPRGRCQACGCRRPSRPTSARTRSHDDASAGYGSTRESSVRAWAANASG